MARKRADTKDPTRIVGYLRVSTDDQALGPDAQRAALARYAAANGAEIVAVFEDIGVSGGAELDARPGLLAAIDAIEAHGAGVLLVAKRDRLARDVVIAAMIERLTERKGARVLTADGTGNGTGPEAMLMRGMIDLFAQYERALIRARTKAALAVKRSRGERTGDIPIGRRVGDDGKTLVEDPAEAAAVATVMDLRTAGLSLRAIATEMNGRAVPARGARWYPTTIARLVRRVA